MNQSENFLYLSRYAGMREDLVQAGGGNSSVKLDGKTMLVKASGYQLSDLTEKDGYSTVDYPRVRDALLHCGNPDALTEEDGKRILADALLGGGKPSIETFLHAITGTYTLHTHPVTVNILTAQKDAKARLKELFPDALFVPYATPGIELAKTYFRSFRESGKATCQVFFLQNHGLVVSGESADEVIKKTEDMLQRLEDYLGLQEAMAPYHRVTDIWKLFSDGIVWRVTDENVMSVYNKNGLWNHTFCPDCIVFLGKTIWSPVALSEAELQAFRMEHGEPVVIEWQGGLYIHAASVKKAMEVQSVLSFSAQVRACVPDADCCFLPDAEQNFLLHWDAEKFRQSMK